MRAPNFISTFLDSRMIELNPRHLKIAPAGTPLKNLPKLNGPQLQRQLQNRILLKYLRPNQIGKLLIGVNTRQYVTPTPYSPRGAVRWLALPRPNIPPGYVLLLRPRELRNIWGPRFVLLGGGIEYILEDGFEKKAIFRISPDPGRSQWEISIH